jgi:hypothetical protein
VRSREGIRNCWRSSRAIWKTPPRLTAGSSPLAIARRTVRSWTPSTDAASRADNVSGVSPDGPVFNVGFTTISFHTAELFALSE